MAGEVALKIRTETPVDLHIKLQLLPSDLTPKNKHIFYYMIIRSTVIELFHTRREDGWLNFNRTSAGMRTRPVRMFLAIVSSQFALIKVNIF